MGTARCESRQASAWRERHAYERAEDALRDADTALHRAKLLGGNRSEIFDTAALRSVQPSSGWSPTWAARSTAASSCCSTSRSSRCPRINRRIRGLLRWQHPVLGLIPPLEFIPIAERAH